MKSDLTSRPLSTNALEVKFDREGMVGYLSKSNMTSSAWLTKVVEVRIDFVGHGQPPVEVKNDFKAIVHQCPSQWSVGPCHRQWLAWDAKIP